MPWRDTSGNRIQAHGGCVLEHEGTYYWYGENKDGETQGAKDNSLLHRVDVIGMSCYSSPDLYNWSYEGLALPAEPDDPAHDLHPSKVAERPKVLYNRRTGQFVMWLHVDTSDYTYARIGIAVSDTPTGPFRYLHSISPNGLDSRDMTLFQDEDSSAYVIYSARWNSCVVVSRLSADYLSVTDECIELFQKEGVSSSREAPAVFRWKGKYYMLTSGCTGWAYNEAELACADDMMGQWTVLGNPCRGQGAGTTFEAQSAFVFRSGERYIAMFDRWQPDNLRNSSYVWLPFDFTGASPALFWKDSWSL